MSASVFVGKAQIDPTKLQENLDAGLPPDLARERARTDYTPDGDPAPTMLDAALEYLARGWAPIPIEPGDKAPVITNRATGARLAWKSYEQTPPPAALVKSWWGKQYPAAGLGIVTAGSGLLVLDVDPRHGGDKTLADLLAEHGPLPRTPQVATGGGGWHYYFKRPAGEVRNPNIGDGLEVKAMLLAPPTIHPSGNPYRWAVSPDDCPLAEPPAWLMAVVIPQERPAPPPAAPDLAPPPYTPPAGGNGHGDPYAAATFQKVIAELRATPEGDRNNALYRAGRRLKEFITVGRMDRAEVERELEAAARAIGLDRDTGGERGMFATMYSALDGPPVEPCWDHMPPTAAGGTPSPAARSTPAAAQAALDPLAPDLAAGLNALNCTEPGNGEAMALLYGDRLRYDHTAGRWLAWDGVRWAPDRNGEALRLALLTVRQRRVASAQEKDPDKSKALGKWALASESAYHIKAAMGMAAITAPIFATAEQFDNNPWLLGCNNGVLDLRTGELHPGRPDLALTLSTGIEYDPGADCPRWLQFLQEVFKGDGELIAFIRRAIGYTLTGHVSEQCLFLCYGSGANGKSVFLTALRMLLGEYAHNTDFGTFLDSRPQGGGAASPDLAALHGGRLVTASEVKEDRRLNEARIKSLTGGDPVTARPLYGRPFTFVPAFKLWLAVNHRPVIKETGNAIWRRVRLIPFTAYFPPEIADPDLPAKLQAEAPGILAWAVAGCTGWAHAGLPLPAAVQAATAEYQAEQDTAGRFVAECCNEGGNLQAVPGELYRAYKSWCEGNGEAPLTATAFGRYIGERFSYVGKGRGKRYIGLELAP